MKKKMVLLVLSCTILGLSACGSDGVGESGAQVDAGYVTEIERVSDEAETPAGSVIKDKAEKASENTIKDEAENASENTIKDEAEKKSESTIKDKAENASEDTIKDKAEKASESTIKDEAENASESTGKNGVESTAEGSAEGSAESSSKDATGEKSEDKTGGLTEEQALEAIKGYYFADHPDLEKAMDPEQYTIFWTVTTNETGEIVVLYRSYTSAETIYHIDPVSGETYVTERVPGIIDDEQPTGESFNIKDYMN